jgi:hypothetical protein
MDTDRFIFPQIFVASLASLAYEITLTRIFSISLWYHFAFMVISTAMLGIAASGTLLSVYPKLKDQKHIQSYILLFCTGLPVSYLLMNFIPFDPARLSWDKSQILYLGLYYLVLSFPFFFFGLIISSALATMPRASGHIYGADLTGAGTGSLMTLWLLSAGGPEQVVFIISALATLVLCIYSRKGIRNASCFILIVNLLILYFQPQFIVPRISPYKPLETALKFPGATHLKTYYSPFTRIDIFNSPAVRFAPGLSLKYLKDLPTQTGISIDAGDIYAITDDRNLNNLDFLAYLPSSLPYELSRKKEVLILEPKGGLSVLLAQYYKTLNIYKVDSNPLVIRAVREYQRKFSSDIYEKNTWSGLGRSLIASSPQKFDLIDLSLMGSVPAASFGFSEDYRYTVEAFEEYLHHLTEEGMLSTNLFIIPPPRTELRILGTIARASEKLDIKDLSRHIAAIRTWSTITIIFKKTPLSKKEIEGIKTFAHDRRFDMVYYPDITEKESNIFIKMSPNNFFYAFTKLISPVDRENFISDYLFDIRPVYDENPFFHYYLKLENISEIYRQTGEKWQFFMEEGYLLPVVFIQVVFLSLILILLPLIKFRAKGQVSLNRSPDFSLFFPLAYFAFLGSGFMFIEISFIQKMILPLENPSYAAATVLSSILISSGIGSLLSQHLKIFQKPAALLFLSVIVLAYSLFLPVVINGLSACSLIAKIVSVFFILMPAGIFMGIPFPLGLAFLGKIRPELVPWALAVNGCFSVLTPVLVVMLAISAGFKAVLLTGMTAYLLAFCSLTLMKFKQHNL